MKVLFWVWVGIVALADLMQLEYYRGFPLVENQKLIFPDFEVTYKGEAPGPFFPGSKTKRMGRVKTFEVRSGSSRQQIQWSSGTGEVSPVDFQIGKARFLLSPFLPPGLDSSDHKVADHWYIYPEEPDQKFALKTPSLFVGKLESLQSEAAKTPGMYGTVEIQGRDLWKRFSITTLRWVGQQLENGYTYEYDLNRDRWFLPAGYYKIRGEGSPDSRFVFFEVRADRLARVVLQATDEVLFFPSPEERRKLWAKKKRISAEFKKKIVLDRESVAVFPSGFELGLDRIEDQLIGFYVCFDLPLDGTNFVRCTTIPTPEFLTEKNRGAFQMIFSRNLRDYRIEIVNANPLTIVVSEG